VTWRFAPWLWGITRRQERFGAQIPQNEPDFELALQLQVLFF
jgi:hypothetical protein